MGKRLSKVMIASMLNPNRSPMLSPIYPMTIGANAEKIKIPVQIYPNVLPSRSGGVIVLSKESRAGLIPQKLMPMAPKMRKSKSGFKESTENRVMKNAEKITKMIITFLAS